MYAKDCKSFAAAIIVDLCFALFTNAYTLRWISNPALFLAQFIFFELKTHFTLSVASNLCEGLQILRSCCNC